MTLRDFLCMSGHTDLYHNTTVTAHIRQHVQNIDVLASKELRNISYDEICNIYMAILFEMYPQRAFWRGDALKFFIKDARKFGVSEDDINHILLDAKM